MVWQRKKEWRRSVKEGKREGKKRKKKMRAVGRSEA